MKKYHGLTDKRHQEVGKELYEIKKNIHALDFEVSRSFGVSHRATKVAFKTDDAIRTLMFALERTTDFSDNFYPCEEV